MARTPYGRTWWGAQWLQALAQIDHDNRLPRGRAYANRGAVRGLSVRGGKVQAEVQGSRPRPYSVEVRVPPVAPAAAKRLVQSLAADPGLIARLLNRDLDPAVLEQARTLGIAVFPTRWSDLGMHCSCPDWAVPCKHLAAVIYLLSQEIDGDPYLVFKLRGMDLQALLAPHGLHLQSGSAQALPARAWTHFEREDEQQAAPADPAALERLDFSKLPDRPPTAERCCG